MKRWVLKENKKTNEAALTEKKNMNLQPEILQNEDSFVGKENQIRPKEIKVSQNAVSQKLEVSSSLKCTSIYKISQNAEKTSIQVVSITTNDNLSENVKVSEENIF